MRNRDESEDWPDLMLSREVADALGVSIATVQRWALKKNIKSITLPSGHRRFHRDYVKLIAAFGLEEANRLWSIESPSLPDESSPSVLGAC